MATTKDRIITVARNYLRDYPQFFQMDFTPAGRTYEIGSPNVDPASLWVAFVPNSASAGGSSASVSVMPSTDYQLDARNSLLRLKAPLVDAYKILVEGYYYEWIGVDDLSFYADMAIHMMMANLDVSIDNLTDVIVDLIGVSTLVEALWGLISEFSRDIDVIASESVHITSSQRYRAVQNLIMYWQEEYKRRAQALNVGLDRIEVFTLRRRSHATERLVPVFKEREIGDFSPVERLWPNIDKGVINIEDPGDDLREDVYVDGAPPSVYVNNGWF